MRGLQLFSLWVIGAVLAVTGASLSAANSAPRPVTETVVLFRDESSDRSPPALDPAIVARYALLGFPDVFVAPAGPKGLEYTETIRRLDGRRVRLTGFMVRTVSVDPEVFMFAAHPVATDLRESGLADDVPPNVAHAILPHREGCGTAWQPYAVTVFGVLELGNRQERDGRISCVRIRTEYVTVGPAFALIDVMQPHARRLFRPPGPDSSPASARKF